MAPGTLLIRNVRPMAGPAADVHVEDGRIRAVGPALAPPSGVPVLDGEGAILLPALVDGHMHLDKTFWGLPWRPHEAGPGVRDRIENERRLRREQPLPIDVQAEGLIRHVATHGTLHIRTHVDVDTECGLRNLEGVLAARARTRELVSIQVVAFPQSGVTSRPGTRAL